MKLRAFFSNKLFAEFLCVILTLPVFLTADAQMRSSVFFAVDSAVLNEKSKATLDSLSKLNSSLTFRVYGNCDSSGTLEHNKILSEKRAKAVTDYLLPKISEKIKIGNTVGLGETKQINDNSTEELKAKNRRVDIFIEKKFLPGEKISRKPLRSFTETKVFDMKLKDTFALPDINFIGGRHVWLPKAEYRLKKLLSVLKSNPKLSIELQGHICCEYEDFDGEDIDLGTFNLSVTRAEAIKKYLVEKGIDCTRVRAVGLGHLNPVVFPELSEADRTKNRRVELVLLEK